MQNEIIVKIHASEILDSRGNPTVACTIETEGGARGWAAVPSGASTGAHEALELRDKDPARYGGKGVRRAVENIHSLILPKLVGQNVCAQGALDQLMLTLDGTENKSLLGANTILAVSLAAARTAAAVQKLPLYRSLGGNSATLLPVPMMNVLNGGRHADNRLSFQEFMILPVGAPSFRECLRWGCEVYTSLKTLLHQKGLSTAVGDEGGFAPDLTSEQQALELLLSSIQTAGFVPGKDFMLAMDSACTELYQAATKSGHKGKYLFWKTGALYTPEEMISFWAKLCNDYPILSLEDPLAEDSWEDWQALYTAIGHKVQLVGDDLLVTNPKRISKCIGLKAAGAVLVKLNQIGSLSETLDAVHTAQAGSMAAVISHRSGETEDTFIADLAVATGAGQIKTGAPCRSERTAKYNRLLSIEEELGAKARFAGFDAFAGHKKG